MPWRERTSSARAAYPLFSLPIFVARHHLGGVRVWLAIAFSTVRVSFAAMALVVVGLLICAPPIMIPAMLTQTGAWTFAPHITELISYLFLCGFIYVCIAAQCATDLARGRGNRILHFVVLAFSLAIVFDVARHLATIFSTIPTRLQIPPVSQEEFAAAMMVGLLYLLRGLVGGALRKSIDSIRQVSLRTARQLAEARTEAPILLLRSFADDEQGVAADDAIIDHAIGAPRRRIRLEDIVAQTMFARGPLIALANPAVKAAPIGAARDVAAHEDWQDVVLGYLTRAGAIVCFYGRTPSLAWETDQIVAHDKLARTIIVFPPASAQRRSFIEHAPAFAAALGLAHSKEEDEALDQALALVYDRQSQCYRIFKSSRTDAFAYQWAITSAACLLSDEHQT